MNGGDGALQPLEFGRDPRGPLRSRKVKRARSEVAMGEAVGATAVFLADRLRCIAMVGAEWASQLFCDRLRSSMQTATAKRCRKKEAKQAGKPTVIHHLYKMA